MSVADTRKGALGVSVNVCVKEMTAEQARLDEPFKGYVQPWKKWGPYVSERSWGTVREDYSSDGNAWDFLTHDAARSKAYRWGEDGIAGICDRYQIMALSLALWNGRDPILKERMFGLTCSEGNRGEDVKEYYFYLDSTPTHSYMKMLYKYPQREYPYSWLVNENRSRGGHGREFELLDTGIFDDDRYFDVVIEYAKAGPEDICVRIEAFNHGPEDAQLQLLPQIWFRNTWSWWEKQLPEPSIIPGPTGSGYVSLLADDSNATPPSNLQFSYRLGPRYLYAPENCELLFTNNETNTQRLYGVPSRTPYVKDAFHRFVVNGDKSAVNPEQQGTKACVRSFLNVPARGSSVLKLRLTPEKMTKPLADVDKVVTTRRKEADEFYETVHPRGASAEERMVQRQALAGMFWSKQIYLFDVGTWLDGDNPNSLPPASRKRMRNSHWRHLNSMRILSMPEKWEYPWFAAWDLAFHTVAIALADPETAKENLWVLLFEQFQHPSGQIPAYEWEFSDLNPPVHAWAVWKVYMSDKQRRGKADVAFLEKCFHKLLINFAWWVNRVDSQGNNVFEGGFLGLDNITVVDRSERLPGGAVLEQSDATGWMGFYCLYLMRIALELAKQNDVYEVLATKFFQHFIYIGSAMKKMGGRDYQLWDKEEGFFYDVLRYPNGEFHKFRVRSLVGLIPLYAVEVLRNEDMDPHPTFLENVEWFIRNRPELVGSACYRVEEKDGYHYVLSIVDQEQLSRILQHVWDENEFLSPAGIRSLSKYHDQHPFRFGESEVRYEPGEADVKIKGGNSNWRGPIWFPTSYLLIESLRKFGEAFGNEFVIQTPVSRDPLTTTQMADELAERMIRLFKRDKDGRRPIFGGMQKFHTDANWRDCLLFNEYFHGETGEGLGANHQTGWTGLVACLIDETRR